MREQFNVQGYSEVCSQGDWTCILCASEKWAARGRATLIAFASQCDSSEGNHLFSNYTSVHSLTSCFSSILSWPAELCVFAAEACELDPVVLMDWMWAGESGFKRCYGKEIERKVTHNWPEVIYRKALRNTHGWIDTLWDPGGKWELKASTHAMCFVTCCLQSKAMLCFLGFFFWFQPVVEHY